MQVHRSVDNLPSFQNAVITIGTFDGVHEGHKKIIHALKREADYYRGESIIITFDPHPRKIVQPDRPLQLINSPEEKMELLGETGIDHLVIVPFTESFSEMSATAYMENFLVQKFRPKAIIIGYDHHFGKGREGDFTLLEKNAGRLGYNLVEISKHVLHEIDVSSTKIRNAILNGNIEIANELLGYSFFFEGKVISGDRLGRKLGYPTANLVYTDDEKIRPGHGVYAVYVVVERKEYKGMLSVGTRPTLDHSDERVEVNIFDFSEDIYGKVVRVYIKAFLRSQEKYESLEELAQQLERDKTASLQKL